MRLRHPKKGMRPLCVEICLAKAKSCNLLLDQPYWLSYYRRGFFESRRKSVTRLVSLRRDVDKRPSIPRALNVGSFERKAIEQSGRRLRLQFSDGLEGMRGVPWNEGAKFEVISWPLCELVQRGFS